MQSPSGRWTVNRTTVNGKYVLTLTDGRVLPYFRVAFLADDTMIGYRPGIIDVCLSDPPYTTDRKQFTLFHCGIHGPAISHDGTRWAEFDEILNAVYVNGTRVPDPIPCTVCKLAWTPDNQLQLTDVSGKRFLIKV